MYDDAQDALAAEYVLGTLSADEREHAEALMTLDPGFAASVRDLTGGDEDIITIPKQDGSQRGRRGPNRRSNFISV